MKKVILAGGYGLSAAKKEAHLLRAIIDSEPNGLAVLDLKGNVVDCNKEMALFYGTKRESLIGQSMSKFVPPEALKIVLADVKRVMSGEKSRGFVNPFKKGDGSLHFVSWNVNPLMDESNKPMGVIISGHDITDIKQAQEKLDIIFSHTNEVYFMHDTKLKFTYISPNSEKMFGFLPLNIIKSSWQDLLTKSKLNLFWKNIKNNALNKGEKQAPYTLEMKHKGGSKFIVKIDESPVKDMQGNISGMVGGISDVTAQQKAEEELQDKMDMLVKFKKFSVGRELKMIELKKKIERYEEEYGKLK